MASASDSTRAPTRRDFFGSAVGAGIAATAPPIFTVAGTSALAAACDWAIGYRVWVNRSDAYDLSDEALAAELAPLDRVMTRAITEPSAGLGDIQAKAWLLMDDLIEGGHADERYDDARLTMTVLREIIALGS